jgi:hypothetical protein
MVRDAALNRLIYVRIVMEHPEYGRLTGTASGSALKADGTVSSGMEIDTTSLPPFKLRTRDSNLQAEHLETGESASGKSYLVIYRD